MGLHVEITSFENRPYNFVDKHSDVHTFERYQKIRSIALLEKGKEIMPHLNSLQPGRSA
jgi:hypothetical protein